MTKLAVKILVSIVAFNRLELTQRCVSAVLHATKAFDGTALLMLHDNASRDGTGPYFDSLASGSIEVVHYDNNTGFQIPTEAAFTRAKELNCDAMVVVNNDAEPPPDFLNALAAELRRIPTAAIIGCLGTCCSIDENMHGYYGERFEYVELSCAMIDVRKVAAHYERLFEGYIRFAYSEDVLLSFKMRKLGYTIHRAGFSVSHNRGSTSSVVPEAAVAQAENHAAMKRVWRHYLTHRTFSHRIVVRRMAAAGDVILVTPVVRALWKENPLCEVVVETKLPEIFAGNPCVSYASPQIHRLPGDLVIDLDMVSENSPMRHFVTSYARAAGVTCQMKTELYWRRDPFSAYNWTGRWCAIHAGPTWRCKMWPVERFNNVAKQLMAAGWSVLLVGGDPAMNPPGQIAHDLDMRGRTSSLNELGALLSHCQLFVGVDSGPLHVAQAARVPVVGIFGVTESRYILTAGSPAVGVDADPKKAPRAGERHRMPGQNFIDEDGSTIATITVDQVMDALASFSLS